MLIDLQTHSTYSDGYLSPTDVVKFLSEQGVKVAALTDHNTVGGTEEFQQACKKYRIKPIVGIEIYAKLKHKRINLLWYNFDPNNTELLAMLQDSQTRRRSKIRKTLESLVLDGFKLDINKILSKYKHYVSINHLVDDIRLAPENKNKIIRDLQTKNPREEEIINYYFYNPERAKLDNSYISVSRLLRLQKKIGGQLIFNHPAKYNQLKKSTLEELKNIGINGIEVLSPHHSIGAVMFGQQMARELNFIMTGGSDFHRFEKKQAKIQSAWQYYKIDSDFLVGINKIID